MRMKGGNRNWGEDIPKHWKNIIVFGVPMNWDPMYAAAGYSTSYDGYFRAKTASGLLAAWLGELGYAARPQWPGGDYETVLPPIAIQAGMGESARNGVLITPELGPNIRLAAVITNLDLEPDKPINTHVRAFCEECKNLCGCLPQWLHLQSQQTGFRGSWFQKIRVQSGQLLSILEYSPYRQRQGLSCLYCRMSLHTEKQLDSHYRERDGPQGPYGHHP